MPKQPDSNSKPSASSKNKALEQPEEPQSNSTETLSGSGFPIVAIGASAGGLEAFEAFFNAMPSESGIAFVLIAHLDPSHVSLLPELLQKHTEMPVHQVQDGVQVTPNNVYVIPPNKQLTIFNGALVLLELAQPRASSLPIDSFFRSLATDQNNHAIGIILSGTGTDGTLGVKAIKGGIGMVMVQDEASAKFDGMPHSAISTGLVDYVLPPDQMPRQLIKYTRHAAFNGERVITPMETSSLNALQKIYIALHSKTDHDFSLYKKNTICRRIERRMNVHQIDDIEDYARYIQESEREVSILFKELLIGVTNFFRDAAAFDALRDEYLPNMLASKANDYTIRVWVTACSTGEEAYSLAIILQECMNHMNRHFNVQIFGTDIDEAAISIARSGIYPQSIEADVSVSRLNRYFNKEEDGRYRIKKTIREMLVFAPQNVIKDPPFTKLDILSCRNLLIYLGSELQKKLLPVFHYSLKPDGILFLGSSETIGQSADLYHLLDKKWKIFNRLHSSQSNRPVLNYPASSPVVEQTQPMFSDKIRKAEEISVLQLVESILQQSNMPPCAIIDDASNVIYIHGRIGSYLEPAEGRINYNILEMAREVLRPSLNNAIHKVTLHKQEVVQKDLPVEVGGKIIYINLTVKPILEQTTVHGLMVVLFEETTGQSTKPKPKSASNKKRPTGKSVEDIERELQLTRENLQTTIEDLETSNEELKSTNEELQSTNEELQSTNEEMETSKEELQSLNEESTTVNAELQSRIDELSKANDDMKNLLDSTNIATIFLDTELCIRRFTPKALDIIPLSATDAGRPIKHFASNLVDVDLDQYGREVLLDLVVQEEEVKSQNGEYFKLKIRPYRTTNNVIDGVTITLEDITQSKSLDTAIKESETRYRLLFEMSNDAIVLIDAATGLITEANRNASERLGYSREELLKMTMSDLENAESSGDFASKADYITTNGSESFATKHQTRAGEVQSIHMNAKSLTYDNKLFILATWKDLTI